MQPTNAVLDAIGPALANLADFKITDPGTAAATNDYAWLVTGDFAESRNLAPGDVAIGVPDLDDGLTPGIGIAYGAQNESIDPVNGDILMELKCKDVGGFRWESSGSEGTGVFPITVYGYCVTNHDKSRLLLVKKFTSSVVITAANQSITLPPLTIRLPKNSFS